MGHSHISDSAKCYKGLFKHNTNPKALELICPVDQNLNRSCLTKAMCYTRHLVFWTSHCVTGIADIRCQKVNIYNVLILCGTKGSMGNLGNGQEQQDVHYGLRHILVPWLSPAIVRSVPITNNSSTKRSCSRLQHRYKATRKLATSRSVKHKVKKNCVATKKPAKKISQ
jgi:hypothetical protein